MTKKDTMYSLRLSSPVKAALKKAAVSERRSMASLLDKIITEYLQSKGYDVTGEAENRRSAPRRSTAMPAMTAKRIGGRTTRVPCVINDISLGGAMVCFRGAPDVFVDSLAGDPALSLCLADPETGDELSLPCRSERVTRKADNVHIGVSFAKEDLAAVRRFENKIF